MRPDAARTRALPCHFASVKSVASSQRAESVLEGADFAGTIEGPEKASPSPIGASTPSKDDRLFRVFRNEEIRLEHDPRAHGW